MEPSEISDNYRLGSAEAKCRMHIAGLAHSCLNDALKD